MMSEMPIPVPADAISSFAGDTPAETGSQQGRPERRRLRCAYSATFEFGTDQPLTVKGQTSAPSLGSALRDAAKALKRAYPGRQWSSVVVVLERESIAS